MANRNASRNPFRNGEVMSDGKNLRPVMVATLDAGRCESTEAPSRCCMGL